jgi:hypothetical protein
MIVKATLPADIEKIAKVTRATVIKKTGPINIS